MCGATTFIFTLAAQQRGEVEAVAVGEGGPLAEPSPASETQKSSRERRGSGWWWEFEGGGVRWVRGGSGEDEAAAV